jgi:hypothetical protein
MRHVKASPSRPLLAAERCANEPASGGLNYNEAVEEWGRFTSEDQEKWENDPHVRDLYYHDDHAVYVWLNRRFNFEEERWPAGEFICFATPIHSKWGQERRIIYPEQAQHRLSFESNCAWEGSAFDDWEYESFVNVRFYKCQPPPGEPSAVNSPASAEPSRPLDATRRSRTDAEIIAAATKIYDDHAARAAPPPDIDGMLRLLRVIIPGVDPDAARRLMKETPTLATRRRKRGRPPKINPKNPAG